MDITSSIILGITQGLTEFLPISSSGHLILVREYMNISNGGLAFDAVLQLATTLAVLVYFSKDIWKLFLAFLNLVKGKEVERGEKILLKALVIGTIPAVILGLLLEDYMDGVFRNLNVVVITLLAGSLVMYLAEKFAKMDKELSLKKGLLIGFFQSLALIPGMSRSGMTISGGLFAGLTREKAVKFSFLLAYPILFGSGLKKLLYLHQEGMLKVFGIDLLIGSVVAFIVGLLAIWFLIRFLKTHTLKVFIYYRIILAFFILIFLF